MPSELTDTMIVASLDPVGRTASLLGLPRDLSDFTLPDGTTYRGKLNALYTRILGDPTSFGGKKGDDPYLVLAGVVGNMVGLTIPHYAVVDMDGFAGLVDALGGVDVYVETAVCDARYRQLGVRGFEANPGWWRMTGPQALAFARVRKNVGGSDFHRMRRQQDLLVAVRDAIVREGAERNPLAWLDKVPRISTNLPPALIVAAASMAAGLPFDAIRSRLVQPFGRGGTEIYDERGYVLSANLDEIRDAARRLFTRPGKVPSTGRQEPPPARPAEPRPLPRYDGC
jgi:LCP family protein required for cell wall assembly